MKKLLVFAGLAVAGGALGVTGLSAASAPSFAGPKSYPTGRGPSSIAIGDLNGDGKPDLATANVRSLTVSVLLDKGRGTYPVAAHYRAGSGPLSVAIGDLNGDGKADLAIANVVDDTVSVLLNNGDGTFRAKVDYPTGHQPHSIALGDLNGDGRPDLATTNGGFSDSVSVLLNRGDGSFEAKRYYRTGAGPVSVAIGDLNGDRKLDLATANAGSGGNSVSVLLNKGDGSFQAGLDSPTGDSPVSVAIGDLNGDRKPDLATANGATGANSVSVLLNKGDGSFQPKLDYPAGDGPASVAIGDLNGDRKPDLATANVNDSTVSVLAGKGDGSFRAKLDYRAGRAPQSIAIGDLNGDRLPDLATANSGADTVSVLANATSRCTAPTVRGKTLPAAQRAIARANCRVGKIRRVHSTVKKGRVISQRPRPGTALPSPGKVDLVVSRGRRPR